MQPTSSLRFLKEVAAGRAPGQLVLQYTDACNASCPQCGMRVSERFPRTRLGIDRAKRLIDEAAAKNVAALSFTGGEPLLFPEELTELIRHAGSAGIPYIRTGTNGFLFSHPEDPGFRDRISRLADTLAATPLYTFWISIDSADPAVHEEMRGLPGVIGGIEKALPLFHERGLYPSANLGINRRTGGNEIVFDGDAASFKQRFEGAFSRFYHFVCDLGFTIANACYPMSADSGAVYAATSTDSIVRFTQEEKALLYEALSETIPRFRNRIRIFSPRSSLHTLVRDLREKEPVSFPCRGGIDFFFADSRGGVFPCGFRGDESLASLDRVTGAEECRRCDWECFRDPSELMGPLLGLLRAPVATMRRMAGDTVLTRLWLEDLRYYRACDFFNGRIPPDWERLSKFAARLPEAAGSGEIMEAGEC